MMRMGMACGLLVLLTACGEGSARDFVGLGRRSPDEFSVVSRPPLTVPPDFSLRPPQEGGAVNDSQADAKARALVTGEQSPETVYDGQRMGPADTAVGIVTSGSLESNAEAEFLSKAGTSQADPDIRDKLYQAQSEKKKEEDDSLLSLGGKDEDSVIVDAKAEKERLKKNKDEGKPVNEGETPEVEPADKGVLGELF
jgi:hypothetical protein